MVVKMVVKFIIRSSTPAEASYKSLEFPSSKYGAMSNVEVSRINQ